MESKNTPISSTSFKIKPVKRSPRLTPQSVVEKIDCIRSIPKNVSPHALATLFPCVLQVKVIARPRGDKPMMVADNSGMIPLYFVPEAATTQ